MNLVAATFANGLGNFIMFTPTLTALAKMYDAKIDLYLDKRWKDSRRPPVEQLFKKAEYANEIYEFDAGEFDKDKYEAIYWSSHGERYDAWEYFKINATIKAEFEYEDDSWVNNKMHELDFYIEPLFDAGFKDPIPGQMIHLPEISVYCERTSDKLEIDKTNKLKVGFCNGYFGEGHWDWSRKAWPYFGDLAILIKSFFGHRSVIRLLGRGSEEVKWSKTVLSALRSRKIFNTKNMVDKFDIIATIRRITELDVLVTTDTGLMHVADALGVPLIAIFGSTLASKNGPYRKKAVRLVQSLAGCAPCQDTYMAHLCEDYKCMKTISPADVFSQLLSLLDEIGLQYGN